MARHIVAESAAEYFVDPGAIYCDAFVRRSGMNGEGVRSGAVLVTNTHFFSNVTWTQPDKPASVDLPNHPIVSFPPLFSLSLSLSHISLFLSLDICLSNILALIATLIKSHTVYSHTYKCTHIHTLSV